MQTLCYRTFDEHTDITATRPEPYGLENVASGDPNKNSRGLILCREDLDDVARRGVAAVAYGGLMCGGNAEASATQILNYSVKSIAD